MRYASDSRRCTGFLRAINALCRKFDLMLRIDDSVTAVVEYEEERFEPEDVFDWRWEMDFKEEEIGDRDA